MFWDFLSQVYRLPMLVFKRVLSNPMGIFVYGILSKWYTVVLITTVLVTYWVFKGLEKAGVIEIINVQLEKSFYEVRSVAQNCTPLILDLGKMWECVQNPPAYQPDKDGNKINEDSLIKGLNKDAEDNKNSAASGAWDHSHNIKDPYDDDVASPSPSSSSNSDFDFVDRE